MDGCAQSQEIIIIVMSTLESVSRNIHTMRCGMCDVIYHRIERDFANGENMDTCDTDMCQYISYLSSLVEICMSLDQHTGHIKVSVE